MKLEPTTIVTLGAQKLTLTQAVKQAAEGGGVAYLAIRPAIAPHLPRLAEMMDGSAYEQLISRPASIHDMTVMVDVTNGTQNELYYLSNPRRREEMKLVAR
jgi:hypothetical protein